MTRSSEAENGSFCDMTLQMIDDLHTSAYEWEFAQHNVILVHYQSCVLDL